MGYFSDFINFSWFHENHRTSIGKRGLSPIVHTHIALDSECGKQ